MVKDLRDLPARSPADRLMNEAIELAIEGSSPYPEKAIFLNADQPGIGKWIRRAVDNGQAVVLAYADGSARVLYGDGNGAESQRAG